MAKRLHDVLSELDVTRRELEAWIEQEWLRPRGSRDALEFEEIDVARVRLIIELRRDMGCNDEAVPIILNLLDQLHGLRQRLDLMSNALERLPEETRAELRRAMAEFDTD